MLEIVRRPSCTCVSVFAAPACATNRRVGQLRRGQPNGGRNLPGISHLRVSRRCHTGTVGRRESGFVNVRMESRLRVAYEFGGVAPPRDGIEVSSGFRQGYSYEEWFLGKREDTRSSDWLEVAATEFECQGLELDWTVVCWGGDFVVQPGTASWKFRKFRGTRWQKVRRDTDCVYVANKYRVLLTARRGMAIWIPRGDQSDPTQDPALFDATVSSCFAGNPTALISLPRKTIRVHYRPVRKPPNRPSITSRPGGGGRPSSHSLGVACVMPWRHTWPWCWPHAFRGFV